MGPEPLRHHTKSMPAKLALASLLALAGCAGSSITPSSPQSLLNLQGFVLGGQQPIAASEVQLYTMGSTGDGSASVPLLSHAFQTGANGGFTLTGSYTCPSASSQVFLVAAGGSPTLSGSVNTSIALIAALGPCGKLSSAPLTKVNEVTTVGSIWPLAPYAKSVTQIGSGNSDASALDTAIDTIGQLISVATGTAPGPMMAAGEVAPTAKLYTLASIIATCVNSAGGTAGDGSPCGQLFSYASSAGVPPPSDTLAAALAIAQNPTRNVVDIFDLSHAKAAFQPVLTASPADWTLPILTVPATPTISPTTGALTPGQSVSLADGTAGAVIYYTTDGSTPSAASSPYSGPISVASSETIRAVAIKNSLSSSVASQAFRMLLPISVALSPGSVTLTPLQAQAFAATVTGNSNNAVTWSLNPAVGTISSAGIYTAPATIPSTQMVTVSATSVADSTKSASASVSLSPPVVANATYYMSPAGKDSNSGTSIGSPWLTPNHPGLNCGDTITAAPGNYAAMTITTTPSCSRHDAVWVKCAVFDGCKINQAVYTQGGILVQASFWAFLGWEVTTSGGPYAACFNALPTTSSIHDIYFMNDVANGCVAGGFSSNPQAPHGVDYFAVVSDIAYNAAQGNAYCYSGVNVYQPVAADTNPGTHIYVSQIFSWQNLEPPTCAGTSSTDGEGIIFDTFNGSQGGLSPYAQQSVIENVITVYNGAFGVLAGGGSGNSNGPMYVRNATAYGNFINKNQNQSMCAQMASVGWPITSAVNANRYTTFTNNLAISQSAQLSGCGGNTPYAYYFANIDGTDSVSGNAGYSASGQSIDYAGLTKGFAAGINSVGVNPVLANPVEPPAPSCSTKASVIDCMSAVIANFRPTNAAYGSYGYQPPSSGVIYEPLFPSWLCGNPNMPLGLVTMGCAAK